MRMIPLIAATAFGVALGAANALAMGGGNLAPEESPYAILAPQTLAPYGANEGRSVYTGGDSDAQPAYPASRRRHRTPVATPDGNRY
jgi:hypothetical protein